MQPDNKNHNVLLQALLHLGDVMVPLLLGVQCVSTENGNASAITV
jgi:hypothetical protein